RVLEVGLKADPHAPELRGRLHALYERTEAWSELADHIAFDAQAAREKAEQVLLYKKAAEIHLTKRRDPARAADLLVKATELQPTDRELLLGLCDAYAAAGRGKEAAETLQRIVDSYGGRRSKDLAQIHHRLAKAYLSDGEKDKALTELDVAFKI